MTNLPSTIMIPVTGISDAEVKFNLSACSEETIINLIRHGAKQIANDANAGRKAKGATDDDMIQTVADKLTDLERNEHSFGQGGGARLTPVERECRLIVKTIAMQKGSKSGDAEKLARDWARTVTQWANLKGSDAQAQIDKILAKAEANIASRTVDAEI